MDLVQDLSQRHEALLQERSSWETDWKALAKHFLPMKCRILEESASQTNQGGLRSDIVDNTGVLSMRDLSAGMHGGMTSPARPWFRLGLQDDDMAKFKPVRAWLDISQTRMRNVFHRSNFYNVVHMIYSELGTFGTGFMFALKDKKTVARFLPLTVGEYCLDVNEHGRVDTVFRVIPMTTRQLVRRFGYNKCPSVVQRIFDNPGKTIDRFDVVHAVYPRDDRKPGREDGKNKAWASVYYIKGRDGGGRPGEGQFPFMLSESGFNAFPGMGPRWDVVTMQDVYGRSPGMNVLGDVRQLCEMQVTKLKALHKEVDPPMAKPSDTKGLSLLPGAENTYDITKGGGMPIYPLLNVRPNIQNTAIAIKEVQDGVRRGLYNDLFKMLMNSDRRQITAREIAAREDEKLVLLGPVLERLHDELFIPLIDRTWELMVEMDYIPAPPPEVQGQEIKVEFISLLAQAQKMVATTAVDQFMGFVGAYSQINPDLADVPDYDSMADGYAEYLGLEADMLKSLEDRKGARQDRAKQMQAAAAAQQAQVSAKTAQTMSQTPVQQEQPNALDALLGSFGGGA